MSVVDFNDSNFKNEVLDFNGVALVDFWAPWCGPCQIMGPIIDEIAANYGEKIKVGKVNVDENKELAGKYEIMSIPSLIIFNYGQIAEKIVGVQPKEILKEKIDGCLIKK